MGKERSELIFKVIPEILYRLCVLVFLLGCVLLSEGVTRVLLVVLGFVAIVILVLDYVFRRNRRIQRSIRIFRLVWIGVYAAVFIITSLYYNEIHLRDQLPMRHARDQHIYQEMDEAEGRLPDAYLRNLIRYKTVRVPYKVKPYYYYNPIEDEDERGSGFVAKYYIENNFARYFNEYSGQSVFDDSLPKIDEVDGFMGEGVPEGFSDLGLANDLLRYTFMLNKENSKETRYFWYSWYYYSFADEENHFPRIYVDKAGCEAADELVAIWDAGENLYLMSLEAYEDRSDLST